MKWSAPASHKTETRDKNDFRVFAIGQKNFNVARLLFGSRRSETGFTPPNQTYLKLGLEKTWMLALPHQTPLHTAFS